MEQLDQLSLALIAWLQQSYPQIQPFMVWLGSDDVLAAIGLLLLAIYWCVNKQLGKQLGYILLTAVLLNTLFKSVFRQPRPFWLAPELGLADPKSYGLPSGHVQFAVVIGLFLAAWYRRWWLWIAAVVFIALFMLNRLYLGVHFLTDIFAGLLLGLFTLATFGLWKRYRSPQFFKRILGQRIMILLIAPLLLVSLYAAILFVIGPPNLGVPWAAFIPQAEIVSRHDMASATGALIGFAIGIVLEGSRVFFRTGGSFWKRAGRYLVGLGLTAVLWLGLSAIMPDDPRWLRLPLIGVRAFLVALWMAYGAPWLFVRTRLAEAETESEVRVTL